MIFKDKQVSIFGLGKSGLAAARKLISLGAKVFVSEAKEALDETILTELLKTGVQLELGGHTLKAIQQTELIIVSPGIHLDLPVLQEAVKFNIPIISEIELASYFISKPIIAITGTNGKTTTTTLIGEMLKAAGKKIMLAGNIGIPLIEVDDRDLDYVVVEVSSYQLEGIKTFKPWISLILNIQPDHLERHQTIEEYIKQKAKIFSYQTGDDYLIYNADDPQVSKMVLSAKPKRLPFAKAQVSIITLDPKEIKIPGRHNLENALAAAQAAFLCGVNREQVAVVLKTFPGVEHRIEYVTAINGVSFYNDSKGTNPDSTLVAIETFKGQNVTLILGGKDKGVDISPLTREIKQNVANVVLIGEATELFAKSLQAAGYLAFSKAASMADAVKQSQQLTKNPGIILLSPACASFDMYNNYEERGREFKKLCHELNQ